MGTDIHIVVEHRAHPSEGWSYAPVDITEARIRNYDVFAVLAGIRNRGGLMPIGPHDSRGSILARGIPWDASTATRSYFHDDDENLDTAFYHTVHWLGLDELLEYPWHKPRILDRDAYDRSFVRWSAPQSVAHFARWVREDLARCIIWDRARYDAILSIIGDARGDHHDARGVLQRGPTDVPRELVLEAREIERTVRMVFAFDS